MFYQERADVSFPTPDALNRQAHVSAAICMCSWSWDRNPSWVGGHWLIPQEVQGPFISTIIKSLSVFRFLFSPHRNHYLYSHFLKSLSFKAGEKIFTLHLPSSNLLFRFGLQQSESKASFNKQFPTLDPCSLYPRKSSTIFWSPVPRMGYITRRVKSRWKCWFCVQKAQSVSSQWRENMILSLSPSALRALGNWVIHIQMVPSLYSLCWHLISFIVLI